MSSASAPVPLEGALELFAELCELSPGERERRLSELAATSPATAGEIARLLSADEVATGPLERLREGVAEAAERRLSELGAAAAPDSVGPWRLVERIGSGGMGEVWRGERTTGGFEQRAAIKLVRAGMATEGVVARFLVERQLLARLEHRAIAKVLDGGVAPDGRPWFAMELVAGRPITEFADQRRLTLEARVLLIAAVADAVDFAHRSLVVHRDIKPSNILVDDAGEPKLLDFGLAKMLETTTGGEARTELQALTPAYAAPEQVLGEPITMATDVYSLGVVLYELATGARPHRRQAPTGTALAAEVANETTPRPSSAVRPDVHEGETSGARAARFARRLKGDLDTVILKALAREPARRYASAADLARDLRSWLAGRPVAARPDTLGYRSAKFARRHAVALSGGLLLVSTLVAGLIGTTWQARRAERQAARAERVQQFLIELFEGSDPDRSRGATITARELLAEGSARLETGLAEEPETRAALLDAVAQIERRLGLYDDGERHARAALATREGHGGDGAVSGARLTLAEILVERGEAAAARAALEPALAALAENDDPDAAPLARARAGLLAVLIAEGKGDEGLEVARALLERALRVHGESSAEVALARHEVGQMLELTDRFDEARGMYEASLARLDELLGPGHAKTESVRLALAEVTGYLGDRVHAEELFRKSIEGIARSRGEEHLLVAHARIKLALVLINAARHAEADRELEAALATFERVGHFDAASCLRMLGNSLFVQERYAEAAERYRAARDRFRAQLGPEHQLTWIATANLGGAEVRLGELERGSATLRAAITGLAAAVGDSADALRQPLLALGEAQRRLGAVDEALATHRRLLAIAERTVGPRHLGTANARREIALDLEAGRDPALLAQARHEIELALAIRAASDPNHPRLADWWLDAARLARAAGDVERATAAAGRAAEIREAAFGADDPRTRAARAAAR